MQCLRECPLKEEFSYPMGPLIRRGRSLQLEGGERLKGCSGGSPGEEVRRELFQNIRRSKGC